MNFTNQEAGSPLVAHKKKLAKSMRGIQFISVVLLFSASVLILALIASFVFGSGRNEGSLVNNNGYQSVSLTNGQTYFGQIKAVNDKYVRLDDIYYLAATADQSKTTTAQNASLIKLGCEASGPADEMVINRAQVTLWQNLKSDGKVSKLIADFKKANPNGQKCS